MKKDLITEVRRIKEIMLLNEGWGSLLARRITQNGSIVKNGLLNTFAAMKNRGYASSSDEISFQRLVNNNDFENAIDIIGEKFRIVSDSDYNRIFDDFMESLDSSYTRTRDLEMTDLDNISKSGGDVFREIDKRMLSISNPEYAELYGRRLKNHRYPQHIDTPLTPASVNSINRFTIESMTETPTFKNTFKKNSQAAKELLMGELLTGANPRNNAELLALYMKVEGQLKQLADIESSQKNRAAQQTIDRLSRGGKVLKGLFETGKEVGKPIPGFIWVAVTIIGTLSLVFMGKAMIEASWFGTFYQRGQQDMKDLLNDWKNGTEKEGLKSDDSDIEITPAPEPAPEDNSGPPVQPITPPREEPKQEDGEGPYDTDDI